MQLPSGTAWAALPRTRNKGYQRSQRLGPSVSCFRRSLRSVRQSRRDSATAMTAIRPWVMRTGLSCIHMHRGGSVLQYRFDRPTFHPRHRRDATLYHLESTPARRTRLAPEERRDGSNTHHKASESKPVRHAPSHSGEIRHRRPGCRCDRPLDRPRARQAGLPACYHRQGPSRGSALDGVLLSLGGKRFAIARVSSHLPQPSRAPQPSSVPRPSGVCPMAKCGQSDSDMNEY